MDLPDWHALDDEPLLDRKISQLGLSLPGTPLEPLIQQLYAELTAKGLGFHPPCHVGDEWFVPVGIPAIFVLFFLVYIVGTLALNLAWRTGWTGIAPPVIFQDEDVLLGLDNLRRVL